MCHNPNTGWMDFARLLYWQRFEELCKVILRLERAEFRALEGAGGDSGIDGKSC